MKRIAVCNAEDDSALPKEVDLRTEPKVGIQNLISTGSLLECFVLEVCTHGDGQIV